MDPGLGRRHRAGRRQASRSIADPLPLAYVAHRATVLAVARLRARRPRRLHRGGRRDRRRTRCRRSPRMLSTPRGSARSRRRKRQLRTLLVTGDSMSTPLDSEVGRLLVDDDVRVIREPHLGTGISKSFLVDWGQLSARQVTAPPSQRRRGLHRRQRGLPDEGARRPRRQVLRRRLGRRLRQPRAPDGRHLPAERRGARLLDRASRCPAPRPRRRSAASSTRPLEVATQPWRGAGPGRRHERRSSPRDGYRDAMTVDGVETIVRQPDGIHLNEKGRRAARGSAAEADPPGLCVLARTAG